MDMGRERIGEQDQNRDKELKTEELHRITVSKQAERALSAVVEKVNDGFVGGKVNRTQVANWILARFNNALTDAEIKDIRAEYFDEVAVLESILRKAKETGRVPAELKGLLQKQLGLEDAPKRRPKKGLTDHIINDDIEANNGA